MDIRPVTAQSPGFALRPFSAADTRQVVALINADAVRTLGSLRAAVDSVGRLRLQRYVPPSSEQVVALAGDEIVGYAYLADRDQSIVYEVSGAVHPLWWGHGVGASLLAWAERRGRALDSAPPGVKTVLQTNIYAAEARAQRLVTRAGFTPVRQWLHLAVELDGRPAAPTLPSGLTLRPMDLENDWDIAGPAMDDAFADHWGTLTIAPAPASDDGADATPASDDEPVDVSFSNAPGFCFIVLAEDTVAAGILCNAKIVERGDTGRVGSLFVCPAFRRRGLGRALLLTAFDAFWRHGLRRIVTDTDSASFTEASRLYTNVGMRLYRRELLYQKTIRPGREVRRLT
jgi:mycothiol synthase